MQKLGTVVIDDSILGHSESGKQMEIEVFSEDSETLIRIDCHDFQELLSRKLPSGILIPIISALRDFFSKKGSHSVSVKVIGKYQMNRKYPVEMTSEEFYILEEKIKANVRKFVEKKKH